MKVGPGKKLISFAGFSLIKNLIEMGEQISEQTISEGKTTAIIAYLTIVGLVIAFVMNHEKKNAFASYHIRQSIGILCVGIAFAVIGSIPVLGFLAGFIGFMIIFVLWILGLLNALNDKVAPVPVIGEYFEKWFAGIG